MLGPSLILVFLISFILTKVFVSRASHLGLLDIPNNRSAHAIPTPRGGGVIFVVAWAATCVFAGFGSDLITTTGIACPLLIAGIGFLDDRIQLSIRVRLLSEVVIALAFSYSLCSVTPTFDLGFFSVRPPLLLSLFLMSMLLVWSANIFNFMDGIDGLASIEGIGVLLSYFFFIWYSFDLNQNLLSILYLISALVGFLFWNFPKASVFMGDVGSIFLGFFIAGVALIGQITYHVPIYLFFIVYGVFVTDTLVTIIRRITNKEKWYLAHRTHAYQRLHHILQWPHARILIYVSCFNMTLLAIALLAFFQKINSTLAMLIAIVAMASYYSGVEFMCLMKARQTNFR